MRPKGDYCPCTVAAPAACEPVEVWHADQEVEDPVGEEAVPQEEVAAVAVMSRKQALRKVYGSRQPR